jgi:hypothetical protein
MANISAPKFKVPDEIEGPIRAHWRMRCLQHCRDHNLTSLYMILKAAVRGPRNEKWPDNQDPIFPRFGNGCRITKDGIVTALYQVDDKTAAVEVNVGTVMQIRDALRRMADRLVLVDADRIALFALFSAWIEKDARAVSET